MAENEVNKVVCPKCKSQNTEYVDGSYRCLDCGCEWHLSEAEQPKTQSLTIRNSTMEFLIFQAEGKEQGVEVFYRDENLWATQKAMSILFDVGIPDISKHLKNIFETGELQEPSVVSKMETTAADGKRYKTAFYNLDAIIAVG